MSDGVGGNGNGKRGGNGWGCACIEGRSEKGSGESETAAGEDAAKLFEGAGDALLCGVVARAEGEANGAEVEALEMAQQDGFAVGGGEAVEGVVKHGCELGPLGVVGGRVVQGVHFHGSVFTGAATAFGPDGFGSGEAGMAVQPAAEEDIIGESRGFAGKVGEDDLGDVLREVGVACCHAAGGGVDQGDVTLDEFAKGLLGAVAAELAQQVGVVVHRAGFITIKNPPGRESDKEMGESVPN